MSEPVSSIPKHSASPGVRATVVQDGSRLHYGLPLGLEMAGILETVHTDWFLRSCFRDALLAQALARYGGSLGRRLATRRCAGLDGSRIVATGLPSLIARLREDRRQLPEANFVRRSQAMTRQILADGWRDANALVGFVRNIDPVLCEVARREGLAVVLDQMIAPIDVEVAEEGRQARHWPGWHPTPMRGAEIMRKVERQSWAAADHITCASDYVRDGLLAEGIERDRISVIPYPVDTTAYSFCARRDRKGPIVVGFVGAVSLRKGAPAFLEIAKAFDPRAVRFVMVGPIVADPAIVERHQGAVEIIGPVPRAEVRSWLERFDVFLFPSACEGSAGAVMEAMATGLPVVTTPNSGTPVGHGEDGYIADCQDLAGLARCVGELVGDVELRLRMGLAARQSIERLTIRRYGETWRELLERTVGLI